jgi:hypothetical protein
MTDTTFDDIIKMQNELKQVISEKGEKMLKDVFKKFFDANPTVQALSWTQYTPYFNDGDTCEFSINEINGNNNANDTVELHWGEAEEDETIVFSHWKYEGPERQAIDQLASLLCSSAGEEVLRTVFGDHVKVVVTREGFEVEEYEHD